MRIGVSSEEPVEREFGMEVLSHSEGGIDTDFIASGRSPLLLDHDMTTQIGLVDYATLNSAENRAGAKDIVSRSTLR